MQLSSTNLNSNHNKRNHKNYQAFFIHFFSGLRKLYQHCKLYLKNTHNKLIMFTTTALSCTSILNF
jgi:hypothetical protein